MPHVASDLGLHCLPMTLLQISSKWYWQRQDFCQVSGLALICDNALTSKTKLSGEVVLIAAWIFLRITSLVTWSIMASAYLELQCLVQYEKK